VGRGGRLQAGQRGDGWGWGWRGGGRVPGARRGVKKNKKKQGGKEWRGGGRVPGARQGVQKEKSIIITLTSSQRRRLSHSFHSPPPSGRHPFPRPHTPQVTRHDGWQAPAGRLPVLRLWRDGLGHANGMSERNERKWSDEVERPMACVGNLSSLFLILLSTPVPLPFHIGRSRDHAPVRGGPLLPTGV